MALRLAQAHLNAIQQHGASDYPNECCGALLGIENNGVKEVQDTAALRNIRYDAQRAEALLPLSAPETESERNRFLIDPADLLKVEKDARARGMEVLGYYHSHPDHPARPSEYDRAHAFPWYSYVIIAVEGGKPSLYTSWTLRDDRSQFDEELIEVADSPPRFIVQNSKL